MNPNLRGSLAMVLSMAAFAVEDAFFKQATASYPVGPSLVIFGLFGLMIFALLSRFAGEPVLHPAITGRAMLLRSGFELAGRLFFALALAFAPLSSTSAILQATPLVVTLGAVLFLGAEVGVRRWLAMAIGFAGVVLILRPTGESFEAASIFAVLATLGFAGRDLATRISPASMSGRQLGTLGFVVLVVAGLILTFAGGQPADLPQPAVAGALVLSGVFGVIAYASLTVAMRTGEISVVTPFRFTRLIFALTLSVLWFGERPDAAMLFGAAMIVGSGVFTLLRQGGKKHAGS